jgi:hypothetical protein
LTKGTDYSPHHLPEIETVNSKWNIIMRGDISSLLKELQGACRRSLYNGMLLGGLQPQSLPLSNEYSSPETETVSQTSSTVNPSVKRRRKTCKAKSWEDVSTNF